jgi:hypothetical protein
MGLDKEDVHEDKRRQGFPTRGPSGSEERRRREEGPS